MPSQEGASQPKKKKKISQDIQMQWQMNTLLSKDVQNM